MAMAPQSMDAVNQALAPLDQACMESLIGTASGAAAGRLTVDQFAHQFAQLSGLSPEDSAARVATITQAYQAQANEALRARSGIQAGDLPAFYAWAKANHSGALQEAFQRQARMHDVSGYKDIASKWMASTAPSLDAFKKAGIPVRAQGQGHEVFIRGQWISPGAAAKAGLA